MARTAVMQIFKEIWQNRQRIVRLARYENRAKMGGMVFSQAWNIMNPVLQILVYWFVFDIGLKTKSHGDIPYVIWVTVGLLPWMSISQAMTSSANSIFHSASTIKNIAIPLSIIPVKSVVGVWLEHFYSLVVIFAVVLVGGIPPSWHFIEVIYYYFAGFCFLTAFALISSSISVLFKDFQKILPSVIRLLFYVSNVVWQIPAGNGKWSVVFKLNPLSYLIDGYRNCLLFQTGMWENKAQLCYFWSVTLLMFFAGAIFHKKVRDTFIDSI